MGTTVHILVVEDNEDEAFLLIHELKRAGYDVVWKRVDTPDAMRQALTEQKWDVITSDHKMPRFSAPEALRLAKEVAPEIPVIIVSGEIDLDLAVSLLKDGAIDYVQKDKLPLAVPSIANALEIINRRRAGVYTEEEVRALSERLLLATSATGVGIWEYRPSTNEAFWDNTVYRNFGYDEPPDIPPLALFRKHVHEEDYDRILNTFKGAITDETNYDTEFRITTRDGRNRVIQAKSFIERDNNGNVIRIVGTDLDITELRQAINEKHSIESSFHELFHNSKDAIIIIEAEGVKSGTIVSANPTAAKMHGYSPSEMVGMSVRDLNAPTTSSMVEERINDTLQEQRQSFNVEHIRKDGSTFWLEVTASVIETGGRKFILGIERELPEQQDSASSSKDTSERLERLAQITSTVVGELSLKKQAEILCEDMRKTFGSDACILRLLEEEQLNMLACAGIPESSLSKSLPARYGLGEAILQSGRAVSIANIAESPYAVYLTDNIGPEDGERRFSFVSYAGAPIRLHNEVLGIIAIFSQTRVRNFSEEDLNHLQIAANHIAIAIENARLYDDVRRQKQELEDEVSVRIAKEEELRLNEQLLERRVQERTAQLEEANRELEAFSYSVSHDLRSPIRSIQGFSTLLMRDYESVLDEEGLDSLRRVIAASRRLNDLIDSMLSLSRIAREELHMKSVNLSDIAHDVLFELRTRHPERKVDITVEPKLMAHCDPRLMQIALTNLIDNAWKFTQNEASARIECGRKQEQGTDCFYIRDNGAGFDPGQVGRLFAPFQRLHHESEFEGTGVGLAIVHRVIQRHDGRIWAESTPSEGTTFYFTLGR
ncbi:MAG: PAS domain-containing protein [Fimbriimonadaceae bacterium]|nr:PAS domain-containing protein [Fimbriimonadaceae bacterium]